ncbi:MAG: hypothetical protein WBG70_10510 [Spirulinaceae cyanobacterium]
MKHKSASMSFRDYQQIRNSSTEEITSKGKGNTVFSQLTIT